jgi:hypothetical protein
VGKNFEPMYQAMEEKLGHPADFRVKYRFYSEEEGGRQSPPFQGYRSDFWYDYQNHVRTSVYMIWPEFENTDGKIVFEVDKPINSTGTARMWIVSSKMRQYHRNKIKPGLIGYMVEGSRKVAECEVIELVGLNSNPIE